MFNVFVVVVSVDLIRATIKRLSLAKGPLSITFPGAVDYYELGNFNKKRRYKSC